MRKQVESYNNESGGRYRRLRPGPGLSREQVAAHQQSRLRRAVIEILAADGYQALTVRRLTKRARISSGALYEHFRSTDDCFLSTFDLACRHAAERMERAGKDGPDPDRRLTLALDRLFGDMAGDPQGATFALRAAPAAGPGFTGRLWESAAQIGAAVQSCLHAGDGPQLPEPLLEAVVAGLARIGRTRVLRDEEDAGSLALEAADWIMSLCVPEPANADPLLASVASSRKNGRSEGAGLESYQWGSPGDDRAMILAATFRIAKDGYHQLSIPRICREAGIPRRSFERHFTGIEDAFSSALEERVIRSAAAWLRNGPAPGTWSGAICEALRALCGAIEADPEGARVLFAETSAAGTDGTASCDRQIAQIARILRTPAPEAERPTELAAEASTAGAWAILGRRALEQSPADTDPRPALAFLALAPGMGPEAALSAIEPARSRVPRK